MDKEKQIEEMGKVILGAILLSRKEKRNNCKYGLGGICAEALINAGYGNVKAAEHRAEVAEKALERTVIELLLARGYSALMAVIRAKEFFIPEAIKEAEKELSEENKNA